MASIALTHGSPDVRSPAIQAVGFILLLTLSFLNGSALSATKEETVQERDQQRRHIRKFLKGLRDQKLDAVQASADALAEYGSPLAAPPLWDLYAVGDASRKVIALRALARLRGPFDPELVFQEAMRSPLFAIRKTAAHILGRKLGRDAAVQRFFKFVTRPKEKRLAHKRDEQLYRYRAVQLIAHLGGPDAGRILLALLEDSDSQVASAAAEGLAVLGDLKHVPGLLKLIETKDPERAPAIRDALEMLTSAKNGFDQVKWEQWLEDFRARKLSKPKKSESDSSYEEHGEPGKKPDPPDPEDYQPAYQDPQATPLRNCGVDIVFVHDTTGSLKKRWLDVVNAMRAVWTQMLEKTPSLRLGSVRYRSDDPRETSNYMIKVYPLTRKVQEAGELIQEASFSMSSGSKGWHLGLKAALESFTWRANARKIIMVLGDRGPPSEKIAQALRDAQDAWTFDGIQCNAVLLPTKYEPADHIPLYGLLARMGSGRFYRFMKQSRSGHLADFTERILDPKAKIDLEKVEEPGVTYQKWLTPKKYPAMEE